jgi:N-acetylmuramoyl-L-alanine amidase
LPVSKLEAMMRPIHLIVIHCSATRANRSYTVDDCRRDHRDRGYADIGYHYYIARDGEVHTGRPLSQVGAHARGFNKYSIGICYEGGLDNDGRPADTRTPQQRTSLDQLLTHLKAAFPQARIVGHNQLNPHKACPCFEVL